MNKLLNDAFVHNKRMKYYLLHNKNCNYNTVQQSKYIIIS